MESVHELIGTQAGLLAAFFITAAIVVLSGTKLSLYGDALGERTGLGSGLIGLIFLAAVTSLPELVVSLTSVIQSVDPFQGADLATGNMLGSNLFNLLILAAVALLFPRRFEPWKLANPHTGSMVYGLILLAVFSGAFLLAGHSDQLVPGIRCGWGTLLLPVFYLFFLQREHRRQCRAESAEDSLPTAGPLAQMPAIRFYSILCGLCLLIIGGGILLSQLGSRMALPPEQGGFGLEANLIGTLFLAISTSLPELVVSLSSVRLGLPDMAIGNVLGSNMFNLLIVFAADTAMRGGNLLRYASPVHWSSVVLILLLTLLAGLLLRCRTRSATIITAVTMITAYLVVMALTA